jgi:RNA-directed DNA polymerase
LTGKGEPYTVSLMKAADVRIERHVPIRHEANPYDPQWESYYEGRLQAKVRATLLGRETLRALYEGQGGRCGRCGESFECKHCGHRCDRTVVEQIRRLRHHEALTPQRCTDP